VAKKKDRIIFHVDMDHFFAAVEERKRPEIRGEPVVVGADPKEGKGRGVVSTCNYKARNYGIKSGIPITRAWRLCPDAVYLPVNFSLYQKVSAHIMGILRSYADKFEGWGLDEAFLDVTSRVKDFGEAEKLAKKIKKEFLLPLRVNRLIWVGRKTENKLNKMGIKTIGDLANYDASILLEKFGVAGTQLYLFAQGIDNSEVQEQWERKSMSREITFEEDTSNSNLIFETLDAIAEDLHKELMASNFTFKTINIKIRYANFETHTHGRTLPFFTDRLRDIQKSARDLVQAYFQPDRKIRLIGVRLSNLFSTERQMRLTT